MKRYKNKYALTVDEMNELLELISPLRQIIYKSYNNDTDYQLLDKNIVIIDDKKTSFTIRGKINLNTGLPRGGVVSSFQCRKDDQPISIPVTGGDTYKTLKQYCRDILPDNIFIPDEYSAAPLLWFNEKYTGQRFEGCYGYDINSSYSWAMLQPMPNTRVKPRCLDYLKENEIGFDFDMNVTNTVGDYCFYIYPRDYELEECFKNYVETWYRKKCNAKTVDEKSVAKAYLNYVTGYLQLTNSVLRAAIVSYAKQRVKSYIDENTLYCNTDSIVSKVRRLDIEKNLGPNIGQWKIEHQGSFAYIRNEYQWNHDLPTLRGVSKSWIKPDWDILKDERPNIDCNEYLFNKENNRLEIKNEIMD